MTGELESSGVLPDVFVLGAPKCGTTAVTRYLEAHPEVFVAERKDIHYFGRDLGFRNRDREERGVYLARFDGAAARTAKVRVESSVWYLYPRPPRRRCGPSTPRPGALPSFAIQCRRCTRCGRSFA